MALETQHLDARAIQNETAVRADSHRHLQPPEAHRAAGLVVMQRPPQRHGGGDEEQARKKVCRREAGRARGRDRQARGDFCPNRDERAFQQRGLRGKKRIPGDRRRASTIPIPSAIANTATEKTRGSRIRTATILTDTSLSPEIRPSSASASAGRRGFFRRAERPSVPVAGRAARWREWCGPGNETAGGAPSREPRRRQE